MNRRAFLGKLGRGAKALGIATAVGSVPGWYTAKWLLNDQPMKRASEVQGYVACDTHVHLDNTRYHTEIKKLIGEPGLMVLMPRPGSTEILTYEEMASRLQGDPDFYEITPGQLAKYKEGYFAKGQEVQAQPHHLLSIGPENYLPQYENPFELADAIRKEGAVVGLAHPCSLSRGRFVSLPETPKEQARVEKLCETVDFFEGENGHNIDLVPDLWILRYFNLAQDFVMAKSNRKAIEMAQAKCNGYRNDIPPITNTSDTHREPAQAKTNVIYVPETSLESMAAFQEALRTGNFIRPTKPNPVSRCSFAKGIGVPIAEKKLGSTLGGIIRKGFDALCE